MKKLSVIFFLFVLHLKVTDCQSFDISKLGVKDIEQGFANIDPLRIILIEQGFKFMQKEESIDSVRFRSEWWRYVNNEAEVSVNMTLNHYPDSKDIDINVNKKFQDYATYLHTNIKKYFPEKKLLPDYELKDGYAVEKGFRIIYYRKDSKIEVQYSEGEEFYFFVFYWNYNILGL